MSEKENKEEKEEVLEEILEDLEADASAEKSEEPKEEQPEEKAEAHEEKGHKKKKDKADKKTEELKEKVDQLQDKCMRQMAEFENFRKRSEKEKSAMFETGAKSVIEKILPVVDNFERGLATIPEEEKGSPFADGMNMIYRQLMTELENMGVKPIEAVQ